MATLYFWILTAHAYGFGNFFIMTMLAFGDLLSLVHHSSCGAVFGRKISLIPFLVGDIHAAPVFMWLGCVLGWSLLYFSCVLEPRTAETIYVLHSWVCLFGFACFCVYVFWISPRPQGQPLASCACHLTFYSCCLFSNLFSCLFTISQGVVIWTGDLGVMVSWRYSIPPTWLCWSGCYDENVWSLSLSFSGCYYIA